MDHAVDIEAPLDNSDDGWELTDEIKRELDRRLADDDAHPEAALTWDEVQERIRSQS